MKKWIILLAGFVLIASLGVLAYLQLLAALSIPLVMLLFLAAFPLYAVVGKSSLLWGLFDLNLSPRLRLPIRHYFTALSVFAVAGSAICIIQIVRICGHDRFNLTLPKFWPWISDILVFDFGTGSPLLRLFLVLSAITVWFMAFALATSWNQDRSRSLARMIAGVILAIATGAAGAWVVVLYHGVVIGRVAAAIERLGWDAWLGAGYRGHLGVHLTAALAWILSMLFYAGLGFYGRSVLGKDKMVAALIGPLMAILVLGWAGSAVQFYVAVWHIPLLLVVAALGWFNGFLPWADHTYELLPRNATPAAPPFEVLTAGGRNAPSLWRRRAEAFKQRRGLRRFWKGFIRAASGSNSIERCV